MNRIKKIKVRYPLLLFFVLLTCVVLSCHNKTSQPKIVNTTVAISSKTIGDTIGSSTDDKPIDSIAFTKLRPIFGYRFIITGDFNGDGKTDTLVEHYYDRETGKETNKYYDSISYDNLVQVLSDFKQPYSFFTCTDSSIDTLRVSDGSQLLGIAYAKNEGDLNGDGTDELSYVVDWADWSNLNTCHILTYKDNRWQDLYSFDMRESYLPDHPGVQINYSLFGVAGIQPSAADDSAAQVAEKELKAFPGLIKNLGNGKIKIQTYSESGDDVGDDMEKVIDLKKHLPKLHKIMD